MSALEKNETWEMVSRPKGKKKWDVDGFIFQYKADGTLERYKARLVAKGHKDIRSGLSRDHCSCGEGEHGKDLVVISSSLRLGFTTI